MLIICFVAKVHVGVCNGTCSKANVEAQAGVSVDRVDP